MLPSSAGALLSYLLFAIVRPLATSPDHSLALMLKPYSMGPAMFLPEALPPLSFGWFVCSYLDVFGIWSLVLLISGALHFLQLNARKTLWLTLGLMLLSFALITGLWNAVQQSLLR